MWLEISYGLGFELQGFLLRVWASHLYGPKKWASRLQRFARLQRFCVWHLTSLSFSWLWAPCPTTSKYVTLTASEQASGFARACVEQQKHQGCFAQAGFCTQTWMTLDGSWEVRADIVRGMEAGFGGWRFFSSDIWRCSCACCRCSCCFRFTFRGVGAFLNSVFTLHRGRSRNYDTTNLPRRKLPEDRCTRRQEFIGMI